MAVGAAIGSVVGGVMQMGAAEDYSDEAAAAAAKGEEYMGSAMTELEAGKNILTEQVDYASQFSDMMNTISEQYGDYANDMMQDWENTFGSMQQNLVDYYNDLDPVKFSTQAKAQIGKQMDKGMQQFEETAAQTGIYTSGMKMQAQKDAAFQKAEAFAQADIAAPEQVAQMKQGFYGQFGEPQRQVAQNTLGQSILNQGTMAGIGYNATNAANTNLAGYGTTMAGLYQDQSQTYLESAAGYGEAAGESAGSGLSNIISGVGGIATSLFSDRRLKENIRYVGKFKDHNIYEWDWTKEAQSFVGDSPTRGVMAQEVMKSNPVAISMNENGYLMVDYGAL